MHLSDLFEQITPTVTRLRRVLPRKLVGRIADQDLLAAYQTLVAGHSPGNVQSISGRRPAEALLTLHDALEKIAGHFTDFDRAGEINIYRGITVSKDWIEGLRHPHNSLGLHWSLTDNYVMDQLDDFGDEYLVLAAEVAPESIDWAATIPEIADGVEEEIILRRGAPVTLLYIEPSPDWTPAREQVA